MPISRRQLGLLLPALAVAAATPKRALAQARGAAPTIAGSAANPAAPRQKMLDSKNFHDKAIPYTGNDTKKMRRFFYGETHGGFGVEVHDTILAPGAQATPPHQYIYEEFIILVDGTLEAFSDGKTEVVEPGSVMWFGANKMHNVRNIGTVPARYYVVELHGNA